MDALLEFARGPMFRLAIAIMVFGMARILILDIWSAYEAYRRAGDKRMPWKLIISRTIEWLFPVKRVLHNRPVYSIFSIIFHIGLLIVPLFLYAHVTLWQNVLYIPWPTLPYDWALGLTLTTIIAAIALLMGRFISKTSSFLSRKQDYLWPMILLIPFATGFICAHLSVSPESYKVFILMHIATANLILIIMPFTKIAHCVLMPLSQVICTLAWKFPPDTDDDICTTLNKKGARV